MNETLNVRSAGFRKCSGDILMCQGCSAMITGRGTAIVISKITCSLFFSLLFLRFVFTFCFRSGLSDEISLMSVIYFYDVHLKVSYTNVMLY